MSDASASTGSVLASATPIGPRRASSAARASRQRVKLTSTMPSAGTAASSPSFCQGSSTIPASLNSGIDAILEGLSADAPISVDEALALAAGVEVGRDQGIHRFHDLVGGHGRPEDRAERGLAEIDIAAQADLVELDPVLVDAQDANVAHVVMAAGVDAARDLDFQVADIVLARQPGEMIGNALRHRDGARIGQRAIVEPWASDDVGDLADIGLGETQPTECAPYRRQILDGDMREDQVLLVAHADLAVAVRVGDVGDPFHLHRAGIARRRAGGLQRGGDDTIAGQAMS